MELSRGNSVVGDLGNGNRVYIPIGGVIHLRLPHTPECIRLGIAGKSMHVELIEEGVAEILRDDGTSFPLPVLASQVGIHADDACHHWVPTNAVIPSQLGLEGT